MIEKTKLHAVLDTNIIIAAFKSRNPNSPNIELLDRWIRGEFTLIISMELLAEYLRKMEEKHIPDKLNDELLANIMQYAQFVTLPELREQLIVDDPDDDIVIGTALAGGATHLVTYDPHLRDLGSPFRGIKILDGLHFLYAVRGDVRPEA